MIFLAVPVRYRLLSPVSSPPSWDRYQAWVDYAGDIGVVYMPAGYSDMGHLLSLWMGIEPTVCATADWPDLVHEIVETVNGNNLDLIDL